MIMKDRRSHPVGRWGGRKWGVAGLTALVALVAAACGSSASNATSSASTASHTPGGGGATFSLRLSSDLPAAAAGGQVDAYFAKEVQKLTHGRVTVKVYPLSQLGTEATVLTAVQSGSIDFADLNTGSIDGQIPKLGLYSLPFLIHSEKGAAALFTSSVSTQILSGMKSNGVDGLAILSNGPFELLADKAVTTPTDLKGMKIRVVTDPISTAMVTAFGASPVPLPSLQVYSALQQGVVDGAITAPPGFVALKWDEVAKHLSMLNPQWDVQALVASPATMARLPASDRQAVLTAVQKAQAYDANVATPATNTSINQMKSSGVTVTQVSDMAPFRTIAEKIYPQFASTIGSSAISAAEKVESSY